MFKGAGVALGCASLIAWAELQNLRWSRAALGPDSASTTGSVAVVVLGFKNPQPRANVMNRWRAEIGLRSLAMLPDGFLIVSGGMTSGGACSEASKIAEHLRRRGFEGPIVLEEESASTWENVANVLPLVEDCDGLVFASQPGHAVKARVYLRRQRPEWGTRLRRGRDYRCLEHPLLKVALAAYGRLTLRGIRPDELAGP